MTTELQRLQNNLKDLQTVIDNQDKAISELADATKNLIIAVEKLANWTLSQFQELNINVNVNKDKDFQEKLARISLPYKKVN